MAYAQAEHLDTQFDGEMLVCKSHESGTEVHAEVGNVVVCSLRILQVAVYHLRLSVTERELGLREHCEALRITEWNVVPEDEFGIYHLLDPVIVLHIHRNVLDIDVSVVELEHVAAVLHPHADSHIVPYHIAECGTDIDSITRGVDVLDDKEVVVLVVVE